MDGDLYPLRFVPVYKDYLWGGTRIRDLYGRAVASATVGESWEVADREDGMSTVANGACRGMPLRELAERWGPRLLGRGAETGGFPLLVKIIDAARPLSVQVHPGPAAAAATGGEPKTEMWYVLAADPGAGVYAGFKAPVSPEDFAAAVSDGSVAGLLRRVPVTAGTAVFVPAGRIHAIDRGCLILEIQQNSNTTYRVYDWGRVDRDGRPRPLHLEAALAALDFADTREPAVRPAAVSRYGAGTIERLLAGDFFVADRIRLRGALRRENDGRGFHLFFTARGNAVVSAAGTEERLGPGSTCVMPAGLASYRLAADGDAAELIAVRMP